MLTKAQRRALEWLRDTPHHRARWMTGTEDACGVPENWTHIEIAGATRRIRITRETWKSIDKFTRTANKREISERMFVVNKRGMDALK